MCLAGIALAQSPASQPATQPAKLGTRLNPIQCGGPAGERAYLRRLRDGNDKVPGFSRDGSVGAGLDGHILDLYTLETSDGKSLKVYMDMYHDDHVETQPIADLTIVAP